MVSERGDRAPSGYNLSDPRDVETVDKIRMAFGAELETPSGSYANCLYKPASDLPYPKDDIRRALEALLEFAHGQRESPFLDYELRSSEAAETLETCLVLLDNYVEVPPGETLPTDRKQNVLVGSRLVGLRSDSG